MSQYSVLHVLIRQMCMLALLGASSSLWATGYHAESYDKKHQEENEQKTFMSPVVVRVTGYGAYEKVEDMTSEPKRLMALRAAKLDAYRALAERIYGTGITGTSTVQDFVLKHDGFGTVVDTVIRGARVVSVSEKKGAGFETVLELLLPGDFQDCLTKTNSFRNGSNCLRPLPQFNAYHSDSTLSNSKKRHNSMDSIYYLK